MSHYFLLGSDGDGLGGINAQGGWSPETVPSPPQYETCNAVDSACVARNQAKNLGWNQAATIALYGHDGDGNGPLGYLDSTKSPYVGTTPIAPTLSSPPVATPAASGGHVTFSTSRGGNALQVGDTWLVAITGATPNAPVTVNAGGATTQMGSTDANGNFSLAGTARTQDVGSWNESWSVGGLTSGAFQFTISAPAAPVAPVTPPVTPLLTPPVTPPVTGTSTTSAAGASSSSTVIGGFDLSTIPTWAWLGGAVAAALFMFKGGR